MTFHGIDLHSDSLIDARITNNSLTHLVCSKYYLNGESFKKFKESLSKDDYVIFEPCTNAFWLYDQIKDLVKGCYILNTIKYRNNLNKTDKIDTKKLVKKLAYYVIAGGDEDDLPTIFVPAKEVREIRGLFSTYRLNKKIINQIKNRIHSILKENGYFFNKEEVFRVRFKNQLNNLILTDIWKFQINSLLKQLEFMEKEFEVIKNEIIERGYKIYKEDIEILLSLTGISPLTAVALMSDAVDVNRFKNDKKFCAYLRGTPKVKGSNDKNKIGTTNRASRSLTCSLLSQSINHFAEAGEYLKNFYGRVKIGKKSGVYRMALIRKILVCVYYMLKRRQKFHWINNDLYKRKINELNRIVNNKKNAIAA